MNLTTIQSIIKSLVILLTYSLISGPLLADLSVNTNRSQYSPSDNINLKIETTNPTQQALDLSPLQQGFIIIDQKKLMINSYAEGKRTSVVRWELLLRARKSGPIEIPSLEHNGEFSAPLSIFIQSSSSSRFLPVSDMPVILDAQLNREDGYEKALFIYTLNLYSDRPLAPDFSLSAPKITRAKVILLNSNEIQKVEIRGKQYDVREYRYAIFPAEMGRYVIEGPVFNGAQVDANQLEARANNLEINVRARQDFDNASYWLPAQRVSIDETWVKNQRLQVGDIIEREIIIQMQGITAAEMPEIKISSPEIVKILSSKVTLSDSIDEKGIRGTKTIRQKIQLLERGELTFDKIAIYWWDTNQDSQKVATIDKNILNVFPGPNGESSIEREVAQNKAAQSTNENIIIIETESSWLIWALIALSAMTSLGWLFNLRKVRRIKDAQAEAFHQNIADKNRKPENATTGSTTLHNENFNAKAELNTFQTLGRACLQNDLISANRRLLEWANYYWYQQPLESIGDIVTLANNDALAALLKDMQHCLDTHDVAQWQGKSLFELLTQLRDK